MKNLLSIAALVLALLPIAGEAQPIQTQNLQGNYLSNGAQIAPNIDPQFTLNASLTGQFDFTVGEPSTSPFTYTLSTNISLLGVGGPNGSGNYSGIGEIPIQGFSIQCAPYNATLAATSPGGYPYGIETNGIAGGTVTFHEYKQTTGAGITIGTLVLPSSPHGGPYVDTATVMLASQYVPTANSVIDAQVTTINPTPTEGYSSCIVKAILE